MEEGSLTVEVLLSRGPKAPEGRARQDDHESESCNGRVIQGPKFSAQEFRKGRKPVPLQTEANSAHGLPEDKRRVGSK